MQVETKVAYAREVAERLIAADTRLDAAYIAGSTTVGLGNSTSDVDVFLLTPDDMAGPGSRQVVVGRARIDVESVPYLRLEELVGRLTGWQVTRRSLTRFASEAELDMLIRLRYAQVVVGSPRLSALRCRLTERTADIRKLAIIRWAVEANSTVEDCEGMYLAGDLDSAVLLAQAIVTSAGKAIATAMDDLYLGRKWVVQQLRRSTDGWFPRGQFLQLQRGDWADVDAEAGYRRVIGFTQTCLIAAQTVGWDGAGVASWPQWWPGDGPLQRSPAYVPIRLSDGVLLNHELRHQVVVKPDIALVWGLCNGVHREEVIRQALRLREAVPSFAALDEARCRTALGMLCDRGLVRTGGSPVEAE